MSKLYLIDHIAGMAVAIATDEIEAVVNLGDVSPAPGTPSYVAGLSALRSRVLTVIDVAALVTGVSQSPIIGAEAEAHAIICENGGHSYGLLVDDVDDIVVVEEGPHAICGRVDPIWAPYAKAVVEIEGQPCFLFSVATVLEQCCVSASA